MYYTSTDKTELEAYNTLVVEGEGYDGVYTTDWANIIEHKDGGQFAILKHQVHTSNTLTELSSLDGWFEQEDKQ